MSEKSVKETKQLPVYILKVEGAFPDLDK